MIHCVIICRDMLVTGPGDYCYFLSGHFSVYWTYGCHLCVCDSDTWAPVSKTFPFSNGRHECTPRQKWHASCLFSQGPHSGVRCPSCHCSEGTQNTAKQSFTSPSQKRPVIRPQSTQGLQRSEMSPWASAVMDAILLRGAKNGH